MADLDSRNRNVSVLLRRQGSVTGEAVTKQEHDLFQVYRMPDTVRITPHLSSRSLAVERYTFSNSILVVNVI